MGTPKPPHGRPRQFPLPIIYPQSPTYVKIIVEGPPINSGDYPSERVETWPFALPSLRTANGSSAIEVAAFDSNGTIVARGVPTFVPEDSYQSAWTETFAFDHPLAPEASAYTITAHYHDDPAYEGSARFIVADVPRIGPRIGEPYLSNTPSGATSSYVAYVKRHRGTTTIGVGPRDGQSITKVFEYSGDPNSIGAMVVSPDLIDLRRRFLNSDALIHDAAATCFNKRGDSSQFRLRPGKHIHVDALARAAHALTWIRNDLRSVEWCSGACDNVAGTFVDSPVVLDFRLRPEDVDLIRNPIITRITSKYRPFDGKCIRGTLLLQSPEQLQKVLTLL